MRILFTGGGTLGSVTPLLAVAEELQQKGAVMWWVGTRGGPERKLVSEMRIKFAWMWAPKWRRYFDVRNFFAPLQLALVAVWALFLLLKLSFGRGTTGKLSFERPVIVSAGGFVGVPIVWAGWFFRIPTLLHNQDVRFSLSNRLVASYVSRITYALPDTLPSSLRGKAMWTGNPIRSFVLRGDAERGLAQCGFSNRTPTIMVVGGGTGAARLNEMVSDGLPELLKKYQVIHVTGKGKSMFRHSEPTHQSDSSVRGRLREESPTNVGTRAFARDPSAAPQDDTLGARYCQFEFVTNEMGDLLAAADLVITRAGMGFLNELAALGKPMIIIPIPGSHQEENARYFEKKGAAIVLPQSRMSTERFSKAIDQVFSELGRTQERAERLRELVRPDAAKLVAKEVAALAKK